MVFFYFLLELSFQDVISKKRKEREEDEKKEKLVKLVKSENSQEEEETEILLTQTRKKKKTNYEPEQDPQIQKFREKIHSVNRLDDLNETHDMETEPLPSLSDYQNYFNEDGNILVGEDLIIKGKSTLLKAFEKTLKDWEPNTDEISLKKPENILRELFPLVNEEKSWDLLSTETKSQIMSTFNTVNELLRHFWSAISQNNSGKLTRLAEPMKSQILAIKKLQKTEKKSGGSLDHMLVCMETALQQVK